MLTVFIDDLETGLNREFFGQRFKWIKRTRPTQYTLTLHY